MVCCSTKCWRARLVTDCVGRTWFSFLHSALTGLFLFLIDWFSPAVSLLQATKTLVSSLVLCQPVWPSGKALDW